MLFRAHQAPGRGDSSASDPAAFGLRAALPPPRRLQTAGVDEHASTVRRYCYVQRHSLRPNPHVPQNKN